MQKRQVLGWIKMLNALNLLGLALILALAFVAQFVFKELPCPLCLLQRLGLLAMGFGFLLNMHYRIRPAHYGFALLAAVFTVMVALRQMALHVLPGIPGYGSAIFGLHMYTWCFIFGMAAIVYIAIVMMWAQQYDLSVIHQDEISELQSAWGRRLTHLAFALFFIMLAANVVALFFECGLHECPDNPMGYALLSMH